MNIEELKELILNGKWDLVSEALENKRTNINDCVDAVIAIGDANIIQVFISKFKNIKRINIYKLALREIELREEPLGRIYEIYAQLDNASLEDLSQLVIFDCKGKKKNNENYDLSSIFIIAETKGVNLRLINFLIQYGGPWHIVWVAKFGKNITPEIMGKLAEAIVLSKDIDFIIKFIIEVPDAPIEIIFNQIVNSKFQNEEIIKILEKIAGRVDGIIKQLSSNTIDALVEYFINSHDDKKMWKLAKLIQDVADSNVDRNAAINKLINAINSEITYFGQNVKKCGSIENLGDKIYESKNKEAIVSFAIDFNPDDERFSPHNINSTFFGDDEKKDISDVIISDYIDKYGKGIIKFNSPQIARCSNFVVGTGSKKVVYKYIKHSWRILESTGRQQIFNYIINTKVPAYLYLCSRVIEFITAQQALAYAQAMVDLNDPISMVCLLFNSDILLCGDDIYEFPARDLLARTIQNEYDMVEIAKYLMRDPYESLEEQLLNWGDKKFDAKYGNDYYLRLTGRAHDGNPRS